MGCLGASLPWHVCQLVSYLCSYHSVGEVHVVHDVVFPLACRGDHLCPASSGGIASAARCDAASRVLQWADHRRFVDAYLLSCLGEAKAGQPFGPGSPLPHEVLLPLRASAAPWLPRKRRWINFLGQT